MSTIFHNIDLTPLISVLKTQDKINAVYVHGSIVSDFFRPESDIDIAVFTTQNDQLKGLEKMNLEGELSSLIHRNIHIGVISSQSLIYAKEVIKNGVSLFQKNKNKHELFVATLLSMYAELKENQKEIRDAYTT
jgi:predicted nucleotidyltransferase